MCGALPPTLTETFGPMVLVSGDIWVILGVKTCHLGGPGAPFWHPGVPFWDPGVHRDTPEDPFGSRPRFLWIVGGFWDPLGTHFGVLLGTFCGFGPTLGSFW